MKETVNNFTIDLQIASASLLPLGLLIGIVSAIIL